MSERPVNGKCGKRIADFQYCDLAPGHGWACAGTQHLLTESELSAALALRTEAIAGHAPKVEDLDDDDRPQLSCLACDWQSKESETECAEEQWQAHIYSLSDDADLVAALALRTEAIAGHYPTNMVMHYENGVHRPPILRITRCSCGWEVDLRVQTCTPASDSYFVAGTFLEQWQAHIRQLSDDAERKALQARDEKIKQAAYKTNEIAILTHLDEVIKTGTMDCGGECPTFHDIYERINALITKRIAEGYKPQP